MIQNFKNNIDNSLLVDIQQMIVYQKMQEAKKSVEEIKLPEILFLTSFPPRECGIATFSKDLIMAIRRKFGKSFEIKICPIESENEKHVYPENIQLVLDVDEPNNFEKLADSINKNSNMKMVVVQHEFGFFKNNEFYFKKLLFEINKPIITVFHTVLPNPNKKMQIEVQGIADLSENIVVMTKSAIKILVNDYGIQRAKINLISHGTHLLPHQNKAVLKKKYGLEGRKVLSTFGLISSGKSIETTLAALPEIIKHNSDILFLIIGITHPGVVKNEGESYRKMLEEMVINLNLKQHVLFINEFLPTNILLEYLQSTDVYLFTSKDQDQAVSGTFSYALSSGCCIVSTPIPHAREVIGSDAGFIVNFENSAELSSAVNILLDDEQLSEKHRSNALHKMAPTSWENAAILYSKLFEKTGNELKLKFSIPETNLLHFKEMTTEFGMIQFANHNKPDMESGYTLDDNARALIALCDNYKQSRQVSELKSILIYLNFIKFCQQPEGYFFNYVSKESLFTKQNDEINLADSNGRAIWALGHLISIGNLLPDDYKFMISEADLLINKALININKIHSTRAMAFVIKGLYYRGQVQESEQNTLIITQFANRLVQMYKHESTDNWNWFESYMTYANSILPEAMLCAWLATKNQIYRDIALDSFEFLLRKTTDENGISVVSNKGWLQKGEEIKKESGGQQPIDVAYTVLALGKFYKEFKNEDYLKKMKDSFNWFLGHNNLSQIVYNPCTGGCYDGLESNNINLNQGAESTVSFLMAKLELESSLKSHSLQMSR